MALHIREFAGIAGTIQIAMQPDIGGTTTGLTATGTYDTIGAGGGPSVIELYALGASHTYTVEGGAGRTQFIASGERLTYGCPPGTTITVAS